MRTIEPAVLEALWQQAEELSPLECCGLLWSRGTEHSISKFSTYPGPLRRDSFRIDDGWQLEECYRARDEGRRFRGYYHSHPLVADKLRLSERDRAGHLKGSTVLLVGVAPRRFSIFRI